MSQTFAQAWGSLRQELEARNKRLVGEVASAWEDVQSLLQAQAEAFRSLEPVRLEPGKIESLKTLFEDHSKRLLLDPVGGYEKKRPLQRALTAIQDYDSGLEDLSRQLPLTIEASGREMVDCLGAEVRAALRKRWLHWHKAPKALALRGIVGSHLQRQAFRRAAVDGGFQLVLAQACLHLLGPWQTYRRLQLSTLSRTESDQRAFERELRWWLETASKYGSRASRLLEGYRQWSAPASARLATAVLQRSAEFSARATSRRIEKRQRYFAYWARQQRSVRALLDLESQLATLAAEVTQATAKSLESLQSEHEELLKELDAVIDWLETWNTEREANSFPPPQARLISAGDRVSVWVRRVADRARTRLPAAVESTAPRRALPGWRSPWRRLEPEKTFLEALEQTGRQAAAPGFREAEVGHRAIIREIERAREVVSFGFEAARSEGSAGLQFAQEAAANALSLLQYQKRTVADARPVAEQSVTQSQAAVFLQSYVAIEKGRLGLLTHLYRQRGLRAAEQLLQLGLQGLRWTFHKVSDSLERAYEWGLTKVGWVAPPPSRLEPVSRRAHLGHILELQFGARDLPMLYRRLFRLAPVEDPRFLIGRDAEMSGLADALSRWESGRSVAVIVVGARGSGKTSLLNCAAASLFGNVPVVSGQFCHRVTTPAQMEEFLRSLFGLPQSTDLQSTLKEGRRVVILEEFERTFLRTLNGFHGLRYFLHLMDLSSGNTLWIVSTNETSFRYLNVVTGLSQSFSHRINAMSVKPEDLTSAILQRHNLSGLRLECAPPPEGDPRISEVRRFFGLEQDPQELFFEALYEESEGIFRSAFELWQGCIERVEGGVVHMRQPLRPNYRPLLMELKLDDFFALQAVLQHGSLTEEELGRVLGTSTESSRARMERLLALEILEPEPLCPGFRVKPEAGRFVRDALHRHNLL